MFKRLVGPLVLALLMYASRAAPGSNSGKVLAKGL